MQMHVVEHDSLESAQVLQLLYKIVIVVYR